MKTIVTVLLRSALSVLLMSMLTQVTWADARANYEEKVNANDQTIGVIAGVINYVCPKLVDPSVGICNPKDPVGSAVAIQKQMGDLDELDELDQEELEEELTDRKILHVDASMQFSMPWNNSRDIFLTGQRLRKQPRQATGMTLSSMRKWPGSISSNAPAGASSPKRWWMANKS